MMQRNGSEIYSDFSSIKNFFCKRTNIGNCKILKDLDHCLECYDSFKLNSELGICESPVYNEILNCIKYSGKGNCIECKDQFYKKSDKECVQSSDITECESYAQAFDGCVKCKNEFKLSQNSANNSCIARNLFPILNCGKKYNIK